MGCGQSKIDKIYPRKRKRRNGSKTSAAAEADADEEVEEPEQGGGGVDEEDEERKKAAAKARQLVVSAGPLSAHTETSSSQLDFFRMLDERIADGPDYDSTSDEEIALERARLAALIRGWESASAATTATSTPRSRSLPATPLTRKSLPQSPLKTSYQRPASLQQNGDLYSQQQQQQQQQQQHYFHQFQMQQYQNMRGQFFMPQQQPPAQYPRVYPQINPMNFQSVPIPQQQASSVVQYRKSRGVYTELA